MSLAAPSGAIAPRRLIVNGDDFGLTRGVSRGILEAHRRGVLTSTSLMVLRPAAGDAARGAREAPGLSVGLHLELDDAELERPRPALERQLRRFRELLGGPPTHLDSHHDVHRDPRVLPSVLEAGRDLGIPVRGHSPARCLSSFYADWAGRTHLEHVGLDSLLRLLRTEVECGITELVCHPGYVDAELVSSYAAAREPELRTLCDARVRKALDAEGIRLVGFRDCPPGDAG